MPKYLLVDKLLAKKRPIHLHQKKDQRKACNKRNKLLNHKLLQDKQPNANTMCYQWLLSITNQGMLLKKIKLRS